MAYCWEPNETLEDALRRIANEQVARAIAELEDNKRSMHESVHKLRTRCKKIRALIRLVRPAFSDYSAENEVFRDLAGTFSELRDADAMHTTIDAICTHYADELPEAGGTEFKELRAWVDRRKQSVAHAMQADAALEKACEAFAASKSRIRHWSLDDPDLTAATAGLTKTYKRGRKGMEAAAALPAPESFHEWRKRAKYHRYHLRLLQRAWPPILSASRKAARDLSDWLGDDHDLAVIRRVLGEHVDEIGKLVQYSALLSLFSRRAAELQTASFSLGRRVYAETPKAHSRRIGALVSAWHSDQLATRS